MKKQIDIFFAMPFILLCVGSLIITVGAPIFAYVFFKDFYFTLSLALLCWFFFPWLAASMLYFEKKEKKKQK